MRNSIHCSKRGCQCLPHSVNRLFVDQRSNEATATTRGPGAANVRHPSWDLPGLPVKDACVTATGRRRVSSITGDALDRVGALFNPFFTSLLHSSLSPVVNRHVASQMQRPGLPAIRDFESSVLSVLREVTLF